MFLHHHHHRGVNSSRDNFGQNGEGKIGLMNAPVDVLCWGIFTPDLWNL